MNEKFELVKIKYKQYLHLKDSGMLSGRFGDREAMRRMNEIRSLLLEIGLTIKDLRKEFNV